MGWHVNKPNARTAATTMISRRHAQNLAGTAVGAAYPQPACVQRTAWQRRMPCRVRPWGVCSTAALVPATAASQRVAVTRTATTGGRIRAPNEQVRRSVSVGAATTTWTVLHPTHRCAARGRCMCGTHPQLQPCAVGTHCDSASSTCKPGTL